MSDVHELLEELATDGAARGADAVFANATVRESRHRQVRHRRRALAAVASAVALVAVVSVISHTSSSGRVSPRNHVGVEATTSTTIASATAAQLAAGHWTVLPPAPLTPRDGEALVWTGTELIVWGGETQGAGRPPGAALGDGAAYNPRTRTWRVLPAAPLSARVDPVAVWTGSEIVLVAGVDAQGAPQPPRAVAYRPESNTWRMLAAPPIGLSFNSFGVWTGDRVVLLSAGTGAQSYDPATDKWRRLPTAVPAPRLPGWSIRRGGWELAVAGGPGRVFAWSEWQASKRTGPPGHSLGTGGSDLFRYDERTNRWTQLSAGPAGISEPEEAFWTGERLLVRGDTHIPGALGPGPLAEVSAWYDPATGVATRLPPDAMTASRSAPSGLASVWTGGALFSFEPGSVPPHPRSDASVYDATSERWQLLPRALYGCYPAPPVWTGKSIIVFCPLNPNRGLEFVPG